MCMCVPGHSMHVKVRSQSLAVYLLSDSVTVGKTKIGAWNSAHVKSRTLAGIAAYVICWWPEHGGPQWFLCASLGLAYAAVPVWTFVQQVYFGCHSYEWTHNVYFDTKVAWWQLQNAVKTSRILWIISEMSSSCYLFSLLPPVCLEEIHKFYRRAI